MRGTGQTGPELCVTFIAVTYGLLKILPSSHSSGVYLLMSIKSVVLDITIGMIKKVIHFNGKPLHFTT